jgi:hypothetical protein
MGTDTTFPLDETQEKEITTFRERVERARLNNESLPETGNVGAAPQAPLAAAVQEVLDEENAYSVPMNVFSVQELPEFPTAKNMQAGAGNAQIPQADEITKPVRSMMDGLFNGLHRMISFPLMLSFGDPIAQR